MARRHIAAQKGRESHLEIVAAVPLCPYGVIFPLAIMFGAIAGDA
jgi:hypothetical protein